MRTNNYREQERNQATTIALVFASASLIAAIAAAQTTPTISLADGGKVWLEGDSTLHKYKADATAFHASVSVAPDATADLATNVRAGKVSELVLTVPVASLKSGEGGLDDNMRKALKSEAYPRISFRLTSYAVSPAKTPEAAFTVQARGVLSIAGVARETNIEAQASVSNGALRLVGSQPVRMTDFGIAPPVLMLGVIRCADQVTIHFDVRMLASQ